MVRSDHMIHTINPKYDFSLRIVTFTVKRNDGAGARSTLLGPRDKLHRSTDPLRTCLSCNHRMWRNFRMTASYLDPVNVYLSRVLERWLWFSFFGGFVL